MLDINNSNKNKITKSASETNEIYGDVVVKGNLEVYGNVDTNSDLKVHGDIEADGNIVIGTGSFSVEKIRTNNSKIVFNEIQKNYKNDLTFETQEISNGIEFNKFTENTLYYFEAIVKKNSQSGFWHPLSGLWFATKLTNIENVSEVKKSTIMLYPYIPVYDDPTKSMTIYAAPKNGSWNTIKFEPDDPVIYYLSYLSFFSLCSFGNLNNVTLEFIRDMIYPSTDED